MVWIYTVSCFDSTCPKSLNKYGKGKEKNILKSDIPLNGPRREKTCLPGFANNKGADQPAHLHRLINAFLIHVLQSIISRLATSEILIF